MQKIGRGEYLYRVACQYDYWKKRNWYYNNDLKKFFSFNVSQRKKILEIGCATGDILNYLKPSYGVGIDYNPKMIEIAKVKYPHLHFIIEKNMEIKLNEKFDYIVFSNLIGELDDIWKTLNSLHKVMKADTRIIVTYYNYFWQPILKLAEKLHLKMPQPYLSWLSLTDIRNIFFLTGYEVIREGTRFLFPVYIPFLSNFFNKFIAKLPVIRKINITEYVIARESSYVSKKEINNYTCSVIVPCRNEVGNIENCIKRIPNMGKHTEIIFVDGNSTDGTVKKIEEMIKFYKGKKDIKLIHQIPKHIMDGKIEKDFHQNSNKMLKLGKGDAVRKGFDTATGDILIILDADLSVAPEDLPKFYLALVERKAEFMNGCRLIYQMEKQSMRFLNLIANKFFSVIFTYLLEQNVKDTLCGTKALLKQDYSKIKENRKFFGDFDPFGDFDLLFGAAKLNLKIIDMPVRYYRRTYGEIKIERFKHSLLLLRMCLIALRKLKFV